MTPKEKAEQLCMDFLMAPHTDAPNYGMNKELAKQCALIAVNEILNCIPTEVLDTNGDEIYFIINDDYKYWEEVKQEIENL